MTAVLWPVNIPPWMTYFPPVRRSGDQASLVTVLAQLVAVAAWHLTLAALLCWWYLDEIPLHEPDLHRALGWRWQSDYDTLEKNFALLAIGLILLAVFCFVAWRVVRARERHATSTRDFLQCWWRSSLWGVPIIPVALGLAYLAFGNSAFGLPFVPFYVLFAPAAIAPGILPTIQRWRPICPECAHTVAYAVEPRCSECGEPYPNPDRFYRRWAIQRLPWDRRRRSLFFGYFQSLFRIVFRPAGAAWSLAIPDRMGRAARWLIGHALLLPIVVLPFSSLLWMFLGGSAYNFYVQAGIVPADKDPYATVSGALVPLQWWIAWACTIGFFPTLVGILLAWLTPRLQPAARRGIIKWSLYAGVVPAALGLLFVLGAAAIEILNFTVPGFRLFGVNWMMVLGTTGWWWDRRNLLVWFLGIYAVWWAIGVSSQPALRHRGMFAFLVALISYVLALQLIAVLFDLRGFNGLL